ncbi:MAG: isoaspartyl peptidase/L-asparaginase [Calditrichia bacterium]
MKKYVWILFMIFCFLGCSSQSSSPSSSPVLVIHGGAGYITPERFNAGEDSAYHQALSVALRTGYDILENGGSALDAVEAAIRTMEQSPLFNAGIGSVLTSAGKVECDASIMWGENLNAGAVASVSHFLHPISGARLVMEKSPHVLLIGEGAEKFLKSQGMSLIPNDSLITPKRRQQWLKSRKPSAAAASLTDYKFGTVGAVALDKQGHLAAGTSTGGMMNKLPGRVGDSPIIGAGTYADDRTCAISATGHGEFFIRYAVAHSISDLMMYQHLFLREAADQIIHRTLKPIKADGGIIGVDKNGNITMTFNTPGMFRGFIKEKDNPQTFLYGDQK